MKHWLMTIVVAVMMILTGVALFTLQNNEDGSENPAPEERGRVATSYEECVDAGFPVIDTYPERCETDEGLLFVRNLPENELEAMTTAIRVEGYVICLPHWDTSGPQTLECAIGLRSNGGEYYALRYPNPQQQGIVSPPSDSLVEVSGRFTPGSQSRHQSIGVIEVDTVTEL